ncbi:MAG: class I SAM-dependent methyltransferase, partial [Sphingomonadaceae bacterium]
WGASVVPPIRVLDFGCGIGQSVAWLLGQGHDAWGVDIEEHWGADFDRFWHAAERPTREVTERLRLAPLNPYRVPFDDASFDLIFSDQVMEHVFNPVDVLRELGRVLKPDGLSIHRFPGFNVPVEGHIGVPVIPLCRYRWWLMLWARLGVRSSRQRGMPWWQVLESNQAMMRFCNYATQAQWRAWGRVAGVHVRFASADGIRHAGLGRAHRLSVRARAYGMDRAVATVLALVSQQTMLVQRQA